MVTKVKNDPRLTSGLKWLGVIFGSLMTTGLIGVVVFLIRVNNTLIDQKVRDEVRNEQIKAIDNNVNTIKSDVQEIKKDDIKNLNERMIRIEEKIKDK